MTYADRPRLLLRPMASLAALLMLAGGCATVAPYERGRLARRDMELQRNAELAAGKQHATAYREGSAGGEGGGGGGCGCN